VAFFLKRVGGTAGFWAAVAAQFFVFALYFTLPISYLWYNVIGCAACVVFAVALQPLVGRATEAPAHFPAADPVDALKDSQAV